MKDIPEEIRFIKNEALDAEFDRIAADILAKVKSDKAKTLSKQRAKNISKKIS